MTEMASAPASAAQVGEVWIAVNRRGIEYHCLRPDRSGTPCGRSTRWGEIVPLETALQLLGVPCKGCFIPAGPVVAVAQQHTDAPEYARLPGHVRHGTRGLLVQVTYLDSGTSVWIRPTRIVRVLGERPAAGVARA